MNDRHSGGTPLAAPGSSSARRRKTILRWLALCALAAVTHVSSAAYSLSRFQSFTTGSNADAAAIGDINGDGRNDVVLTTVVYYDPPHDNKVFVFFQNADGTLAAPLIYDYMSYGTFRTGLALADLDRDGRMDIVVGHGGGLTILRWRPIHGVMAMDVRRVPRDEMTGPTAADDIAILDVNRDGLQDVVAQNWENGGLVTYFGDGLGGISRQVRLAAAVPGYSDLEARDFNGDGYTDVAVLTGQDLTHAYVYANDGSDDFASPLDVNPDPNGGSFTVGALGAGDFNADGLVDLVVKRDDNNLSLYTQDLAAQFNPAIVVPTDPSPNAMIGKDLDLDGRDDVVVEHGGGTLGYYLQGAAGLASEVLTPGPYATWFNRQSLAAGDINGDSCPDIVSANYNDGLVVFLGNGCNAVADLAPNIGVTTTVVAVRLDNFGAAPAEAPTAVTSLSLVKGSLSVGALPAGCALKYQTTTSALVSCIGTSLAAGSSRTVLIPIGITGADLRNSLTAVTTAETTTVELRLDNNRIQHVLRL